MKSVYPLLLAALAGLGPDRAESAGIPVKPVHTNKRSFGIPFRYDAAEMQRLGAREVRLFVSLDQGRSWQHADTVAPDVARFRFEAVRDGEYWFAVRTLDARNRLHPEGPGLEPGLQVVVDTQPPELNIDVQADGAGRVALSWSAVDSHLEHESLQLEYVQNGGTTWNPVSVRPAAKGRTSWSVAEGGAVAVRGTISDRASNTTRTQNQVIIAPANGPIPQPTVPDLNAPIAGKRSADVERQLAEEFPSEDATIESAAVSQPWSPSLAELPVSATETPRPAIQPGFPGTLVASDAAARPPITRDRFGRDEVAGIRKTVNTQQFQIDYKVDDVGPSGVGTVELFITEDGGQKWWKYGEDEDRRSPISVKVPRDGAYGFAIRARSGVGIADTPPRTGTAPDLMVVVDQTPPVVELLPLQQGQGADTNKLLIQWRVTEKNPAARPVALAYAEDPTGPWEPITGWQEDSGSFLWTIGPGVPARLYIRLTVRDAAGNLVRAETPGPVVVDMSRPSAKIVDVEAEPTRGRQ